MEAILYLERSDGSDPSPRKIRWKQSFTKNLPNRVMIFEGINNLSCFYYILVAQGPSISSSFLSSHLIFLGGAK